MSGQSCAQTTRTDFTHRLLAFRASIAGEAEKRRYFFLAAALPLAGAAASGLAPLDLTPAPMLLVMPKRSLKRCTRPPRSTFWRTPVQAGWVLGSMSRRMVAPALPQVDRVSKLVPSVMTTVILW